MSAGAALFLTFSRVSLSSFGGALFWLRRALVERQRWLSEREFVDLLALGQLLPGPNVLKFTVMVGYRFAGLDRRRGCLRRRLRGSAMPRGYRYGFDHTSNTAPAGARGHVEGGGGTPARHCD